MRYHGRIDETTCCATVGSVRDDRGERFSARGHHGRRREANDESGDDYLDPARCFVFVQLPPAAERALTNHTRT